MTLDQTISKLIDVIVNGDQSSAAFAAAVGVSGDTYRPDTWMFRDIFAALLNTFGKSFSRSGGDEFSQDVIRLRNDLLETETVRTSDRFGDFESARWTRALVGALISDVYPLP